MILFLYGKDTFRSRAQLRKMIAKFKEDRDPQGYNTVVLDCEKEVPSNILEQILAIPFLAEKRMVVIENLLISKHKDLQKTILDRVEEQSFPKETVLVFWEGNDKFKTKLAKEMCARLATEKFAQHYEPLEGSKLNGWIAAEVSSRGGSIDQQACSYLAHHVGNDMWQLNSLIDQLVAFAQGIITGSSPVDHPKVTTEHIQEFLDEKVDDNIFNLVDAIVAKKPKQVFAMIQEQYKQGKDPHYVFAMILRQYKILLQLKDMAEKNNIPGAAMAKTLGLHPFVVKKSMSAVNNYSKQELEQIHSDLLGMDLKMKTGQGNMGLLVDVFVGKVCAA